MSSYIHRPRQAVGLIYILLYLAFFFAYAIFLRNDQSWTNEPKLTVMVMLWFILSLAVKVSMFMDRTVELLNLAALVGVMSIGFAYQPRPGPFSSLEYFCYYLNFIGGSACDFFDFLYEGAAKRPEHE